MTTQHELDLIEACKKLSRKVERSWRGLYAVTQELNKHGGIFTGIRKTFYQSFGTSEKTNQELTRCLARAGIVKLNDRRGEEATIELLPEGIKDYLAKQSGINIVTLKKAKRCPECGKNATLFVGPTCYGCYVSSMANRKAGLAKAIEG